MAIQEWGSPRRRCFRAATVALFSCKSVVFVSCVAALEVERWMAADEECRTLCCATAPDPRDSSRAQPAFDDDAAGRHVQFAVDADQFHRLLRADSFDDFQDM